jgi:hypothetical protein
MPCKQAILAVSGVACLLGKQPAALFYAFRHPTPYTYGNKYLPKPGKTLKFGG